MYPENSKLREGFCLKIILFRRFYAGCWMVDGAWRMVDGGWRMAGLTLIKMLLSRLLHHTNTKATISQVSNMILSKMT